jgi:hypothetical protein
MISPQVRARIGDVEPSAQQAAPEAIGHPRSDRIGSICRPAAGHVPRAVNIRPDELATRLAALPRTSHVVADCRGSYCVYADQAADHAVAYGRGAARLVGGFPEWAVAGLPVEMGA